MKTNRPMRRQMFSVIIVLCMIISIAPYNINEVSAKTVKATKIQLNYSTYKIVIGKSAALKATVIPVNAVNKTLLWTSSNNKIATVSNKGEIKGIKEGIAVITATVKGTSVKAVCRIEVQKELPKLLPFLHKSIIASQKDKYIPIEEVGTYNKRIVTDELKSKQSTLPEASNSCIPYWTGFACENKLFKNSKDIRWDNSTDGSTYFYEQQLKFISDNGFNCARMLYSLSFLSNPNNVLEVNEAELEQLDELISWGMKYNVHIMLSISGLPGKAGTNIKEENVQSNDELFRNAELADVYNKYMTMLARRYANIPNRNLSFELLAEPAVPDGNVDTYVKVLTPVVKSMWKVSPGRILIVNDVGKQLPEQMAALGCCLSLHTAIGTVNSECLPKDVDYHGHWPMEYLPGNFDEEGKQVLTLQSENNFKAGTLSFYMDRSWNKGGLKITADGKVLLSGGHETDSTIKVEIPEGTRVIKVSGAAGSFVSFYALKLTQSGKPIVTIPVHSLYTGSYDEQMPTILIKDNGTAQNIDSPQKVLNADYFKKEYLQKFIDCAKKYNVGFLMTEIGTDTNDLNKEEYKAYHNEWLKVYKDNHIPWMYNCLHSVLAPDNAFYTDCPYVSGFRDVLEIKGTPLVENTGIIQFLREYQ